MELPRSAGPPHMARVRQFFPRDGIDDIEAEVRQGLRALNLGQRIEQRQRQ